MDMHSIFVGAALLSGIMTITTAIAFAVSRQYRKLSPVMVLAALTAIFATIGAW